ncbi:hypothetical protein [Kitasatospora sp. MAP5-34]|uniref:hypothetical protein n=1 Tax=Kitasatospora sp. MAP5-34 TaxID=3035102 RepID=UPI002474EE41|nr:hypothetical protein [Kitasatospora sp. MAP5-34]MDH6578903.1 hypothetical protein [Kitasatospora sp. MAP5-34]
MTAKIRRSAGTRTVFDVLLSWLFIRRTSTEKDLADLRAGTTLKVMCMSSTLGTVKMLSIGKGRKIPHLSSGYLHLSADGITWQNRLTKEVVPVQGPFGLSPSDKKAGHWKLTRFDLAAGDQQHVIVIPKADVPLVTQVLEAAAG